MMKPTKAQAKAYLQEALDEIPALRSLNSNSSEFRIWQRNTRIATSNIFGDDSSNAKEFASIYYIAMLIPSSERQDTEAYLRGLDSASDTLDSMIVEIDRWWPNDDQVSPRAGVPNGNSVPVSNRVFVVHGRDEAAKQMAARYLEGLGLEPVILQEQANEGRTIIEKFEDYAGTVGFAVIVGTPDDIGGLANEPDNLQPRMRQNVVFELGYFTHALGRKRVCVLLKGDVERPSDYDGVIYIALDEGEGWKLRLATEMKAAGLPVDMNRLLPP